MNKVFIAGGTGFIGYHSALLFKSLNYEVVSFTLKENVNNLDTSFMKLYVGNLFEMEEKEIIDIFNSEKPDIFIYALGPDERVIPKAPAWNFFYEKLVIQAKKICMAAKKANIAKCVVLNSYFSYFDRLYNNKLSKTHPYIKARVYQEKEILKLKDDNFSVVFLELPYIFGTINNQTPLWKDSFLAPFDNYKSIMFPGKGGTAVIDISGVAQAVVAAAIYGVRAANGVVIITTKKGKRNSKAQITYNGYVGVQNATNVLKMANSKEYATVMLEANKEAYEPIILSSIEKFGGDYDTLTFGADTDWYSELLRTAIMTNHGIDITGGSEKATYAVGMNYLYQNGIMDTRSSYNRLNFRANLDFEATDWLKVGSNIIISNSEQYNVDNSAWLSAYKTPSLIPVYDYSRSDEEAYPEKFAAPQQIGLTSNFTNPVAIAKYNDNSMNDNFQAMANFYAEFTLIPEKLRFKTSYNQDFSLIRGRVYYQPYQVSSTQLNAESKLTKTNSNYYSYVWDNTLTYTDSWKDNNFNVLLGQSSREQQYRKLEGTATNVPGDYDEYLYISQGNATGREVNDDGYCYRGLSYFARFSYDYAGKYLLSATMRADGSSKYQEKWGYFPSVGAAWVISDEEFFKKQNVIEYMKIRASWGQLGNDRVAASDGFASISTGTGSSGVFGNTTLPGFQNTSYFSWLGWEMVEEFNAGVNFALFNSRLSVDFDYYNRITKNAIINTTLPFSTTTLAGNNGEISNSGFDIQLSWNDKIGKDFSYYAGVNLSTLKNRVKSLNGAPYIYGGSAESRTINIVGEEMQSYYGYKVLGVYQNEDQIKADPIAVANELEPGDLIFEDVNNDNVIDDSDRQILGSNIPSLTYSFNLGFQYKNLEFSLSTFGQAGNEIYNRKRAVRYSQANFNFDKDFYDNRWTGEGTSNSYPSSKGMLKAWNNSNTNSFFVEKGNYFRIQNIMLAYNFKNVKIGSYTLPNAKISLTADRPYTYFTSNGFTPEISNQFGWDEGVYPLAATYTFGLTINF